MEHPNQANRETQTMITKPQLAAANEAAELPANLDPLMVTIHQLQADLAASQQRECALRACLEDVLDVAELLTGNSPTAPDWEAKIQAALSTPSPQGWVKLRWRSGKEKPPNPTAVVAKTKYGPSAFVFHNLGPWPPMGVPGIIEWLPASELLEGAHVP